MYVFHCIFKSQWDHALYTFSSFSPPFHWGFLPIFCIFSFLLQETSLVHTPTLDPETKFLERLEAMRDAVLEDFVHFGVSVYESTFCFSFLCGKVGVMRKKKKEELTSVLRIRRLRPSLLFSGVLENYM